jgi:hypothetical protein
MSKLGLMAIQLTSETEPELGKAQSQLVSITFRYDYNTSIGIFDS